MTEYTTEDYNKELEEALQIVEAYKRVVDHYNESASMLKEKMTNLRDGSAIKKFIDSHNMYCNSRNTVNFTHSLMNSFISRIDHVECDRFMSSYFTPLKDKRVVDEDIILTQPPSIPSRRAFVDMLRDYKKSVNFGRGRVSFQFHFTSIEDKQIGLFNIERYSEITQDFVDHMYNTLYMRNLYSINVMLQTSSQSMRHTKRVLVVNSSEEIQETYKALKML